MKMHRQQLKSRILGLRDWAVHGFMVAILVSIPNLVTAQTPGTDIETLAGFLSAVFNRWLIPIFLMLALVYTIWSAIGFIRSTSKEGRNEKQQQMFWGIVGLFVILSIWSLVGVIQNTFNIFGGGTLR